MRTRDEAIFIYRYAYVFFYPAVTSIIFGKSTYNALKHLLSILIASRTKKTGIAETKQWNFKMIWGLVFQGLQIWRSELQPMPNLPLHAYACLHDLLFEKTEST